MVDLQALLEPHHVFENVVRATVIYWMLFLLLRLLPNRKTGGIGTTDLLVVVLLANAVQTAMMRDGSALTDAVLQVLTIMGWSVAFDLLGDRIPALRGVLRSQPVEVVRDGEVLSRNLRREFITQEELDAQLRLQHVDDVSDVAHAYVEHDGRISVIRRRDERRPVRSTSPGEKPRERGKQKSRQPSARS